MADAALYLASAGLAVLGGWACWEDVRRGRIPNAAVASLLVCGVIVHALSGSVLAGLASFGFALAAGFLLWQLGFWTPGDAKLFSALALLLPAEAVGSSLVYAPALAVAALAFSFAFGYEVVLIARACVSDPRAAWASVAGVANPVRWVSFSLSLLAFSGVTRWLLAGLGASGNTVAFLAGGFVLFRLAFAFVPPGWMPGIVGVLLLARGVFDYALLVRPEFWMAFLPLVLLLYAVVEAANSLASSLLSKPVRLEALLPGMFPSQMLVQRPGGWVLEPLRVSFSWRSASPFSIPQRGGMLTRSDIGWISANRARVPFSTLRVQFSMPFAPFLVVGGLVVLLFGSGFLFS